MVSEQIEDSLRQEVESYIEGRLGGIRQEIANLQSQLNESLSRLLDREREMPLDGGVATSIMEHLRAAHEEGVDLAASESARAKASSDMAIVKSAISEIDGQDSQAEILKALINRASSFAPRVAFFVIKGDQTIGWRARGFEGTVGDDAIHQISFPVSADTAVNSVAQSRETWSGGPGSHGEDHVLLNRLGDEPPSRIVAIPLVVRKRTVAVLYADSSNQDSEAINLEALETLARVAGMSVELLASRGASSQGTGASPAHVEEAPSYTPVAEYDEVAPVVEESAPAAEVPVAENEPAVSEPAYQEPAHQEQSYQAPTYQEPSHQEQQYQEPSYQEPVREEPSYQAPVREEPAYQQPYERVYESPAYQEPVREEPPPPPQVEAEAPVQQPTAPQTETSQPRRRYGMDVELPVEVYNDDERRLHNDARRFARLLVSEIKLYNERQVAEGRQQNDLYPRLREYIDRSREMYDKRVKPEVAQKYDYFHQELVNTLAEGDTAKLGSGYPGATVSA